MIRIEVNQRCAKRSCFFCVRDSSRGIVIRRPQQNCIAVAIYKNVDWKYPSVKKQNSTETFFLCKERTDRR